MIILRELFALRSLVKIGLLALAMSALASGVSESVSGMRYDMFFPVAMFAVSLSWMLAFSKWTARRAWSLILIAGAIFIFLHVGHLWSNFSTLIRNLIGIQIGLVRWIFDGIPPDLLPIQNSFNEIMAKSLQVFENLVFALRSGLTEQPDIRELFWDFPILILAVWAGWILKRRENVLYALGPIMGLLAYVLYYSGNRPFPLQVTTAVLLLLMGMNEWEKRLENQDHNEGLRKTISEANTTIIILSVGIALAAGWIPSISLAKMMDRVAEYNRQARIQRIAEALGLEENQNSDRVLVSPGLPRERLVGADPSTSQTVVFSVQTGELPPMPDNEFNETIPRYYWRSVTYDIYNSRGWETTLTQSVDYPAGQPLFETVPEGYRLVYLDVKKTSNLDDRLYWTGTVVSVDQPFQLAWRTQPGSLPDTVDPFGGGDALGAVMGDSQYRVTSVLPVATVEQLRAANQEYPEIIRRQYLILPPTVPGRVHRLAAEITANIANPYDKARAIEAYLRTYPYTLDVPPLPQDVDIADYFLFELLTGYCDYYATSMVVMARSVGLPARMVSGYANGSYLPSSAEYVVRVADAHSWVEIYFPGIGWVEFEPTASQPEILRPLETERTEATPLPVQTVEDRRGISLESLAKNLFIVGIVLVASAAGGLGLYLVRKRLTTRPGIQQIYMRVFQQGNKFAPASRIHETPLMFSARLGDNLRLLLERGVTGQWLAPATEELDFLTNLYVRAVYSSHSPTLDENAQAQDTWRRLYWRLLLARMLRGKPSS